MLKENRVCGKSNGNLDMTAISVFYDAGVNPLRKTATLKAVQHWMMQSHLPDEFLFLELGFDGQFTFSEDDFPEQIHYIRIDGTERNKYLFQKEHLWNIAAKMATYEKLMFIDSDMSPLDDQDWFAEAYGALDGCLFAQGFKALVYLNKDDTPTNVIKYSYFSCMVNGYQASLIRYVNPGGVYCITRHLLQAIGGFNYLPLGGGDALFWSELGLWRKDQPWCEISRRESVENIVKSYSIMLNKDLLGSVNVGICHFHHGALSERSYGQRQYMLLTQYPWDGRLICESANGLAEWKNPGHWFVDVAKNLKKVNNSQTNASEMMKSHVNYLGFERDVCGLLQNEECDVGNLRRQLTELAMNHSLGVGDLASSPLVSVVIPCYNVEQYIDQCLNSILQNGYENLEVICVDDRSTDSTVDHIKAVMQKDKRVQLIHNRLDHNIYGGACRNLGMERAAGKYLYFCDSDDYVLPGLFRSCVERCERLGTQICCFRHKRLDALTGKFIEQPLCLKLDHLNDKSRLVYSPSDVKNIFTMTYSMIWDKLWRMEYIRQIGNRFQETKNSNDNSFYINGMGNASAITYIDKVFYVYRINTRTSVQGDVQRGNNSRDVVSAIKHSYECVEKMGSPDLMNQFKEWVYNHSVFLLNKFKFDAEFVNEYFGFIREVNLYDANFQILEEAMRSKLKDAPMVIVSMTSYPHRFKKKEFLSCLKSIVCQKTQVRFKFILSLFNDDIRQLPEEVSDFVKDNSIEILPCPLDLKSHKKYFYVMQKHKDTPIITVDDDTIYTSNLVEDMYSTHISSPDRIVCGRCKRMARDADGRILPYENWENKVEVPNCKDDDLFGIGVGGILYPSGFCKLIDDGLLPAIGNIIEPDDFLLYIVARMNGFKYMTANTKNSYCQLGGIGFFGQKPCGFYKDEKALLNMNVGECGVNNKCIKFIERYSSIDEMVAEFRTSCQKTKVAICCIAKNENYYINDWVKYHLDLGFDHIYIYDNNDGDDNIGRYIDAKFKDNVTIIDRHNKYGIQTKTYMECFMANKKHYDWMAFIDIDEFITFSNPQTSIKNILSDPDYQNFEAIRLNWMNVTDSGQVWGDLSKPIYERLTSRDRACTTAKSIVNCKANDITSFGIHAPFSNGQVVSQCTPNKNKVYPREDNNPFLDGGINSIDTSIMFIRHFKTKTASEYRVQKINRTDAQAATRILTTRILTTMEYFWKYNERTDEKVKVLESPYEEIKSKLESTWTNRPVDTIVK